MSRPRPVRTRDRIGHAVTCPRPFIEWRDLFGNHLGVSTGCAAIFTRRGPHRTTSPRKESA